MISVLILTYNEEANIQACLESVSWCDDIVVLDSYSTDATLSIAKQHGVTILEHPFRNYAEQRNYGLAYDYKYEWILMLDADERLPAETLKEIQIEITKQENPVTLYRLRRQDFFMGRWIKHSSGYPTWFGRLFKKGMVWVERDINEEYYTDGEVGLLGRHLIHYPFNKGIEYWFERHNRYSSMEAVRISTERQEKILWSGLISADPMLRRKTLKQLAYRLPCRPFLVFCYLYLLRFGFMDGRAGYHYSRMRGMYEYMIDLKIRECGNMNRFG